MSADPLRPDSAHLVTLGGGSGAFAAAIRAAELGARVTMVERGTMGGTCVNRGCVPSKTLIRAAEIRHLLAHHPFEGIPGGAASPVDMGRLTAQKEELVERLRGAKYADVLRAYPNVAYVEGDGRLTGEKSVEVRLRDGGVRKLDADRILIATGAGPRIPALPGIEDVPYWTNEEALSAEEVPDSLLVAGGGPVGVELAQLFARLGSRVTLAAPTLLRPADPELSDALSACLREEGIDVRTGLRLREVEPAEGGIRAWIGRVGAEPRSVEADRLLLAVGRRPNTFGLGLEEVGVPLTDRGFIEVDEELRAGPSHIFAVGDCTTLPEFVYVAARAGSLAAENAVGEGGAKLDLSAMPSVVFTDPQAAWVGLTEAEAAGRGEPIITRSLGRENVPRALANRDTRGFIKIVARESDGRVLGVHVLSPAGGEVIQTAALAVKHGLTTRDLAETLFPYLTEVEGLKLTAQTFTRRVDQLSCCAG